MQGKDCLNRQVNIEARVGEENALDATPEEAIISVNSMCGVQGTAEPSFLGYTIDCVKVTRAYSGGVVVEMVLFNMKHMFCRNEGRRSCSCPLDNRNCLLIPW